MDDMFDGKDSGHRDGGASDDESDDDDGAPLHHHDLGPPEGYR
jgi:hypothetical protein